MLKFMEYVSIKVNANNEIDRVGFSDAAIERFALFLANMAGAKKAVIEKVDENGQGNCYSIDVDEVN